ncbi:MAG: helix-turn-helix domain-containing protein [Cyanobacteria bacterium P01_D01_bin.71]
MAKVLTDKEVAAIFEGCQARGETVSYETETEQYIEVPQPLGRGYYRNIQLHPGLRLRISDSERRHIHRCQIQQHPQPMPLTFSYYLSGAGRVDNDGLKGVQEEVAGKSHLFCLPGTAEIEEYPAEQRICKVHIQIFPEMVQALSDRIHELPTDIRAAIEQPEKAMLYLASCITPMQQRVLKQILQCAYQGITRQLYLEAKVWELIALHFAQMLTLPNVKSLAATDIDRIHQAREILIHNMVCPPSLNDLARQVQLNERKLKEGFRQAFDTTVFGYLQNHRMQQARQLLMEGGTTVQEAASYVGYASRSSFVAAFKKQFGIPPSSCCQLSANKR